MADPDVARFCGFGCVCAGMLEEQLTCAAALFLQVASQRIEPARWSRHGADGARTRPAAAAAVHLCRSVRHEHSRSLAQLRLQNQVEAAGPLRYLRAETPTPMMPREQPVASQSAALSRDDGD